MLCRRLHAPSHSRKHHRATGEKPSRLIWVICCRCLTVAMKAMRSICRAPSGVSLDSKPSEASSRRKNWKATTRVPLTRSYGQQFDVRDPSRPTRFCRDRAVCTP
jgi:hypothetical protein